MTSSESSGKRARPISLLGEEGGVDSMDFKKMALQLPAELADDTSHSFSSYLPVGPASGQDAVDEVLENRDLLKIMFCSLGLGDLCRVSGVNRIWRHVAQTAEFWTKLDFEYHKIHPMQVLALVKRHPTVASVNLKGVQLDDMLMRPIFDYLTAVQSMEMGKGSLTETGLREVSGRMVQLQRWIISDATLGRFQHMEVHLAHDTVRELVVERCKVGRLLVRAPQLTNLCLDKSSLNSVTISCPALTTLSMQGCYQITDFALRAALTRLEALTDLDVSNNMPLSDDTLREVGLMCRNVTSLVASSCVGLTLKNVRGFPALQTLDLSECDSLAHTTMMPALESWTTLEALRLDNCSLITQLTLSLPRLAALSCKGCRTLGQLDLRCPWLEEVELGDGSEASGSRAIKRINLASSAATSICWRGFPNLELVTLACPNLTALDLSCCNQLTDALFETLGGGSAGDYPYLSSIGQASRGCPRLRSIKLDSCQALGECELHSSSLQSLSLAGCKSLQGLRLVAPRLLELHLDECDSLASASLAPVAVRSLSLGTCPRLQHLHLAASSLVGLDLMGCGGLQTLQLECPALEHLDCTYCQGMPDSALASLGTGAPKLTSLVLSVCSAVEIPGLSSLRNLHNLRLLDLSYTDIEELTPVARSCPELHTLKLLSCRQLHPDALQALLPSGQGPATALRSLTDLDVSYCNSLPTAVLTKLLLDGGRFKVLELNGCEGATDSIWDSLHRPSPPQALEVLSVKSCKRLRACWLGLIPGSQRDYSAQQQLLSAKTYAPSVDADTTWEPTATPLAGLKSLRLGLSAIRSLALALPQLAVLDLRNCPELRSLELRCPVLLEAYFESCRSVPGLLLVEQLRCSPFLERLGLEGTQVSEEDFDELMASSPRLHTVPQQSPLQHSNEIEL